MATVQELEEQKKKLQALKASLTTRGAKLERQLAWKRAEGLAFIAGFYLKNGNEAYIESLAKQISESKIDKNFLTSYGQKSEVDAKKIIETAKGIIADALKARRQKPTEQKK